MIRYGTGFQPFDFPPSNRLPGALPQAGMIRAFGALFSRLPMCKLLGMLTAAEIRVRCKTCRRYRMSCRRHAGRLAALILAAGSKLPGAPSGDKSPHSKAASRPDTVLPANRWTALSGREKEEA